MSDRTFDEPAACLHCDRPLVGTSLAVCQRCLERGQRLVADVADDIDRFPYTHMELMGLRSPQYDMTGTTSADDDARLPFGLDRLTEDPQDIRISAAKHPDAATDILASWANVWAQLRGDEPASWDPYLVDHTLWAMQNPGISSWAIYEQEARAVRSTVRRLLGITPVREGSSCPDCGGSTVREWRPRADRTPWRESSPVRRRRGLDVEGLDDVVRCTRCQRSWPQAAYLHLEVIHALPVLARRRPWVLMTFAQLVLAFGGRAGRQTIATWIHRGWLRPVAGPWPRTDARARVRRDGSSERLYRLVDADLLTAWLEAEAHERERNRADDDESVASTG